MGRAKRICYLSPMRAAKVQASLRIRAVSPEPSLLAHTNSESRETFRQKARSLAPLNGWACAVEICHDGMLEDTNSLDGAHLIPFSVNIDQIRQHAASIKQEVSAQGNPPKTTIRRQNSRRHTLTSGVDYNTVSLHIHVSHTMRKCVFGSLRPAKTQTGLRSHRS